MFGPSTTPPHSKIISSQYEAARIRWNSMLMTNFCHGCVSQVLSTVFTWISMFLLMYIFCTSLCLKAFMWGNSGRSYFLAAKVALQILSSIFLISSSSAEIYRINRIVGLYIQSRYSCPILNSPLGNWPVHRCSWRL